MVREALEHHGLDVDLLVKHDGEQMLRAIELIDAGQLPCPDVVLLDLNLPKRNGIELLARIHESAVCRGVNVVIVTSSDAPSDRAAAVRFGATTYFCKPSSYDEYMRLGEIVKGMVGRNRGM